MFLDQYSTNIQVLCETHKVKSLYVFGSVITEKFTDKSDIDFVVDFETKDPLDYADNYFSLKFSLIDLLNRPVDLLEQRGLKNKYIIQMINNSKKMIYEA